MRGIQNKVLLAATVFAVAACNDSTAPSADEADVVAALNSTLASFNNTDNSFAGDDSASWNPRGHGGREGQFMGGGHRGPGGHHHHGGGPGFGGLMGGGLHGLFIGKGFGHGRAGFALPSTCIFNSANGRVECPAITDRHGLTVTRSASYKNLAGEVQQAFDSLTNEVNLQIAVNGTFTQRRDSAQTSIEHTSNRTVSGLAAGSTQRTINGAAAGRETTTGQDTAGAYTLLRIAGDTINGVIIPTGTDVMSAVYPTAGTVIRSMTATLTRGSSARTSTRREVLTYNGSATATIVITENGSTRNCTVSLPRGRPTCS